MECIVSYARELNADGSVGKLNGFVAGAIVGGSNTGMPLVSTVCKIDDRQHAGNMRQQLGHSMALLSEV